MSDLKQVLAEETENKTVRGSVGNETDWLEFCELTLSDGRALVCDLGFIPSDGDGLLVEMPPGRYLIRARVMDYSGDRRVSRLRVLSPGSTPTVGVQIGETWADTAAVAVCDFTVCSRAWERLGEDTATNRLEVARDSGYPCGVFELDPEVSACVPYVDSGFGDGTFPVFELMQEDKRVGFEIEFIAREEPYPFERSDSSGAAAASGTVARAEPNPAFDEAFALISGALKEVAARKTGDREKDRVAMEQRLAEVMGGLEGKVKEATEQFRQHVVQVRRKAPPLEIRLIPDTETEWIRKTPVQDRGLALKLAGFVACGTFRADPIPDFRISGFIHPEDGIRAQITESVERIALVLCSHYHDGTSFNLSDGTPKPGARQPPWRLGGCEPEMPAEDLIRQFKRLRPQSGLQSLGPEDFIGREEEDFRRVQAWRSERGGWTIAELKAQKGLKEEDETSDEIRMLRFNTADMWLFNWLRAQRNLPFRPEEEIENLVIIHDDLTPDLLINAWWIVSHDFKAKEDLFVDGPARDAFSRVNREKGKKLRLVFQKTSALAADFYLPASP